MSRSDKQTSGAVAAIILIHASILIVEWVSYHPVLLVGLNLTVSASLLLYWIQKQIRIQQHVVELRETLVLAFEISVASLSSYSLMEDPVKWVWVSHVIFSVTHLLAALAFFIFMLTFRMRKLF